MRVKVTTIVEINDVVVSENEVITGLGTEELIEPPDGEPIEPDVQYITKIAQSSHDKPHVLLWEIVGWNKVPKEDGGPFPIMSHQSLDERIKIPNGESVAMINFEQRVNGGAVMLEVVGYGEAIALKHLEGQKLYVDKADLR